jgi:hypothetical protein
MGEGVAIAVCESWECINSFAAWIAAIGTVGTLIGTIWIATSDRRPRVKLSTIVLMTGPPIVLGKPGTATVSTDEFSPFFQAEVVNIGQCPVIVDSCGWLVPLGWKKHLLTQTNRSSVSSVKDQSTPLPCTLRYGERANWVFDPWTLPATTHELHGTKFKWLAWLRVRFMKFGITTSVGKNIRARADEGVRDHVWKQYIASYKIR